MRTTSFDEYFVHSSKSSVTSDNVFSNLIAHHQSTVPTVLTQKTPPISSSSISFSRFAFELHQGFNLLFYGFGSKRQLLNHFALQVCAKRGHVVVANAFQPSFTLKDLFLFIENKIPAITNHPLTSSTPENQARRICAFFEKSPQHPHLYVVVHNIDTPTFRTPRAKSCLSLLALQPSIHFVASIDRINAPLLFSNTENSTRKPSSSSNLPSSRGFAWLWHDLTSLAPYSAELAYADPSSISGASNMHSRNLGLTPTTSTNNHVVTETAALHVLASVNQKSKKLFRLIGTQQLAKMSDSTSDAQQDALEYDVLFVAARQDLIASNDAALRSLLAEFKDHGLIVGTRVGVANESLRIPMRKDRLASVLGQLNVD
jgi:origin recognition complex subunit 2